MVEECSLWLSPIISVLCCVPSNTGALLQESCPLRHSVKTPSLNNDRPRPQRTGVETGLNWTRLALAGLEAVGYRCANSCPPVPDSPQHRVDGWLALRVPALSPTSPLAPVLVPSTALSRCLQWTLSRIIKHPANDVEDSMCAWVMERHRRKRLLSVT